MKLSLGGLMDANDLNRIFCARYRACMAEPLSSAFFVLHPQPYATSKEVLTFQTMTQTGY